MSRIDTIIDALYKTKLLFESHGQYPHTLREVSEALAAARELKALKPVAIVDHNHPFSDDSVYMIANYEHSFPSGTKLYALDEVTK